MKIYNLITSESFSSDEINKCKIITLAYIGDAVYALYIKMKILQENISSKTLHTRSIKFLNAVSQSYVLDSLLNTLDTNEKDIITRARNYKTNNKASSASLCQYKKSTSFEALIGHLYLSNNQKRLDEILEYSYNYIKEELWK